MNRSVRQFLAFLMFTVVAIGGSVYAPNLWAAEPAIEDKAMKAVMRMAELLSNAQRLSVTADIGYDVDQVWGQKLEFGATRKITVQRPNRLAVDITNRDGTTRGFRFDGKQIAFFGLEEKAYATAQRSGDIDAALAYFTRDLRMPWPMAELFSNTFATTIRGKVSEAYFVEEATIAGTPCDHIALRNDLVDMQMWIAKGDKPVLERLVITYKLEDGQPQFWADFHDWNFSPDISDSLFAFSPAEGARRIAFVAGMNADGRGTR